MTPACTISRSHVFVSRGGVHYRWVTRVCLSWIENFWFEWKLWTFLTEKCSQNCVRCFFLRKIEKSTKLGPKLVPSVLLNIYRCMQINIAKLLYINVLVEVHGIHSPNRNRIAFLILLQIVVKVEKLRSCRIV